ncbi:hypothetical protein TNCV_3799691 [Trichonephila clavipes]|nr:hypothetical protein TNCV_3799691 [Trichonephila clavipes]
MELTFILPTKKIDRFEDKEILECDAGQLNMTARLRCGDDNARMDRAHTVEEFLGEHSPYKYTLEVSVFQSY